MPSATNARMQPLWKRARGGYCDTGNGLQVFSSTINTLYSSWTQGGGVTAINGKAYEQLGKSKLDLPSPAQALEQTHLVKHHSAITENLTATGICGGQTQN